MSVDKSRSFGPERRGFSFVFEFDSPNRWPDSPNRWREIVLHQLFQTGKLIQFDFRLKG